MTSTLKKYLHILTIGLFTHTCMPNLITHLICENSSIDFVDNPNENSSIDSLDKGISDINSFNSTHRRKYHFSTCKSWAACEGFNQIVVRNLTILNRLWSYSHTIFFLVTSIWQMIQSWIEACCYNGNLTSNRPAINFPRSWSVISHASTVLLIVARTHKTNITLQITHTQWTSL